MKQDLMNKLKFVDS